MATATVSTVAIRNLVSQMASATEASVFAARDSVVESARQVRDAIGGSVWLSIWDPEGPDRKAQQKNLTDAIDAVKKAKTTEEVKKTLIYLQSTIEVSRAFYGNNDAFNRAITAFLDDVKKAPALLVEKVIAPVVKGAAQVAGGTIWAVIKGFWPILLIALAILIGYGVVIRRLSK